MKDGGRLRYLDGCRALAAMLVVFTHVRDVESHVALPPWIEVWFNLGHYAVTAFLVISGFSLGIGWARQLGQPGWIKYFLARRAWRIIPTYWACIALSVALTFRAGTDWSGVGVHAVLMQDFIPGSDPNGVLWSIAIEWHIYFLFPAVLALSLSRAATAKIAALVLVVYALWMTGDFYFDGFTPQYVACFAIGVFAGVTRPSWRTTLAGTGLAALFGATLYVSPVDLPAMNALADLPLAVMCAGLFGMMRDGKAVPLAKVLSIKPLPEIGLFAYSLYLTHVLVLWRLGEHVIQPLGLPGPLELAVTLIAGSTLAVAFAYLFFLVAERPFLGRPPFVARPAVPHQRKDALPAADGREWGASQPRTMTSRGAAPSE